jgi:hypothetical protein
VSTEPIATLAPEEIARFLRGNAAFRLRYHRHLVDAMEAEATAREIPLRTFLIAGAEAGLREDCARTRCLAQSDTFTRESDPATHLPVDGHWSALGHEKVGEALAAWLLADPDLALSAL